MLLVQNLARILIKTHHMTSVKKIEKITKSAKKLDCAVLLKTGRPPGVMLAEGETEKAEQWLDVVKNLRYKNFELMKKEEVDGRRLDVPAGKVKQLESLKDYGIEVGKDEELRKWWRLHMGFMKGEDEG
ncbi:hypothetical protein BCON_0001g00340 [Botryotinia convoluta]|uniref:Uncharacterized protein n=1 Tax=Botryotinia convoluta TaxID=54673 RepID=A0A4Z1J266_9HELO|nr:hypothetical protein BCON_0001g00340 [Botryotinia convoluta]